MPLFKDEHILLIAPGSRTTLAQLGLPESYTPARLRVPTRMFPAETAGEYEPVRIAERKTARNKRDAANGDHSTEGVDAPRPEEEILFEEDPSSDEGAVYPLHSGRVTDWKCFFALLTYIYNTLSPPFHTPIMLLAQPAWTQQDCEIITQFVFEKFKPPGFALVDRALAAAWAFGLTSAAVIDVGYDKCDVTAVSDFVVTNLGRGIALEDCGGETMTQNLLQSLATKKFTHEMCEQLKRSPACEILAPGTPLPTTSMPATANSTTNGTSAASQTMHTNGDSASGATIPTVSAPSNPAAATNNNQPLGNSQNGAERDAEDPDGVLDVASIVASGKTNEFVAKREREKAEKATTKKGAAAASAEANAAKQIRLPNSQRAQATFWFEEQRTPEEMADLMAKEAAAQDEADKDYAIREAAAREAAAKEAAAAEAKAEAAAKEAAEAAAAAATITTSETTAPDGEASLDGAAPETQASTNGDAATAAVIPTEVETVSDAASALASIKLERRQPRVISPTIRREIEVGTERFCAADHGLLDRIADAVHRVILAVPDIGKRGDLWDSMIIVGNGSKVRGFKDALLATLNAKYVISPSSGTIFTSELPSNFSTPVPTGANTPMPQTGPNPHGGSGVNPLLLAATTASNANMQTPPAMLAGAAGSGSGSGTGSGAVTPGGTLNPGLNAVSAAAAAVAGAVPGLALMHGHSQGPTSIRLARPPEYFSEWKDAGWEEAAFLGAQVAAKVVFVLDPGPTKAYMTRTEYNDLGPQGIHEFLVC